MEHYRFCGVLGYKWYESKIINMVAGCIPAKAFSPLARHYNKITIDRVGVVAQCFKSLLGTPTTCIRMLGRVPMILFPKQLSANLPGETAMLAQVPVSLLPT